MDNLEKMATYEMLLKVLLIPIAHHWCILDKKNVTNQSYGIPYLLITTATNILMVCKGMHCYFENVLK